MRKDLALKEQSSSRLVFGFIFGTVLVALEICYLRPAGPVGERCGSVSNGSTAQV